MSEVLFTVEGENFIPSELAGSPWHRSTLHGGAPSGLLAHCLECHLNDGSLQAARLSIDLLRPVPSSPLQVKVATIRKGKRIALLHADLFSGETLLAKASALFVKPSDITVPQHAPKLTMEMPGPQKLEEKSFAEILFQKAAGVPPGLHTTVRLRPVTNLSESGEGSAWIALPVPVIQDTVTTPFVQAATICDFGNGVGQLNLGKGMGTINSDIHLQLTRLPKSQWLGLQSQTLMEPHGIGQAHTVLHDEFGPIGMVSQVVMPMAEFAG